MHTELHIVLTHHFHARVHECIEKYIHVYSSTGSKFNIAGTCIMKQQTRDMKSSGTKHIYQAPYISVTRSCLCEPRYTGRKALASTAE